MGRDASTHKPIVLSELTFRMLRLAQRLGHRGAAALLARIDGCELWFPMGARLRPPEANPRSVDRTKRAIQAERFGSVSTFHGLFDSHPFRERYRVNWCEPRHTSHKTALLRTQIELARELATDDRPAYLVIHPGYWIRERDRRPAIDFFARLMEGILDASEACNVRVLLENDLVHRRSRKRRFGSALANEVEVVERCAGRVGICFDLSHALLACGGDTDAASREIERSHPHIDYAHLTLPDPAFLQPLMRGLRPRETKLLDVDGHSAWSDYPSRSQAELAPLVEALVDAANRVCLEHAFPPYLFLRKGSTARAIRDDIDALIDDGDSRA
ncbi:MAG: sugar phosphate isomerase/epimerase family protein [Candidatus Bipolaricaulia bacterium]